MISTKTIPKKKVQDLILPLGYSEDLAEETGIHIGDGCMNIYRHATDAVYTYSGHANDDYEFSLYVKQLMKKLYNLDPSYERIQKNTILLAYCRTELIKFKHKLGLPLGPKIGIRIPDWINHKRNFKIACLGGIFATDGCLLFEKKYRNVGYYPRLSIASKSEILINQINSIFNELDIKSTISYDGRIVPGHPNKIWLVYIYGKENLKKFVNIIGFCNPKHFRKHQEWKNSAGGGI